MLKKGIASGGNLIVDYVKIVENYPAEGNLSSILDISRSVGGAVANVLIDLAKLDPSVPLQAIGLVGSDENGEYVLGQLRNHSIDTSMVARHPSLGTSFTDVMSVSGTGERTFFHYRGANSRLDRTCFDFSGIHADLIHIGYALLLDGMDAPDAEYGTVMARVLAEAQKSGILTSMDVVSENSDRFTRIVPPSLKYTDYCVINEVEASQITGIHARNSSGSLDLENMRLMCRKLFDFGVSTWVVIHAPEAGFGMDRDGHFYAKPSLSLPTDYIKGKVGAGDAFCAGILYSAYQEWDIGEALDIAAAAAASNLSEANSVDGMRSIAEVRGLLDRYPRMKLPSAE